MGCGCGGGVWTPPTVGDAATSSAATTNGDAPTEAPAPRWSPSGPDAPGYYHQSAELDSAKTE